MNKQFKDSRNEREAWSLINETCCERMMKNCDQGRECPERKERLVDRLNDLAIYFIFAVTLGGIYFTWGN